MVRSPAEGNKFIRKDQYRKIQKANTIGLNMNCIFSFSKIAQAAFFAERFRTSM